MNMEMILKKVSGKTDLKSSRFMVSVETKDAIPTALNISSQSRFIC